MECYRKFTARLRKIWYTIVGDFMQQYFVTTAIFNQEVVFDQEQVHHLVHVMRYETGRQVYVVDPTQKKYLVTLTIEEKQVKGQVVHEIMQSSELPCRVVIAQSIIKGDRFDYFLQKAAEFGVSDIVPLITKRTVVKVMDEKKDKKQQRWQKIVIEAAEQARRSSYPLVHDTMSLDELLRQFDAVDYKLVAYEEANEHSVLKDVVTSLKAGQSLLLVVGCEGGLEQQEVSKLEAHGYRTCALGPRILRAESAGIYALAAISYEMELSR